MQLFGNVGHGVFMTVEVIEKKTPPTAQAATIKFKESLEGRIRNLALSPNAQGKGHC